MRIRTIKPEFWTDATMVQLPLLTRLLFVGLWNCADDHGYLDDEPDRIAMQILPRELEVDVINALELLIACGRVERYRDEDGGGFLRIANWQKHQRVDKPSASKVLTAKGRKAVVPQADRRLVATKYGCAPGGEKEAACYFCAAPGRIWWAKLRDGRASSWVTFPGLELAHLVAESKGGETSSENLVLACRNCNRTMHTTDGVTRLLAETREPSRALATEGKGRERKGEEGNGGAPPESAALPFKLEVQSDPAPPKPKAPRETDALCADFEEVIGEKYHWQSEKDGTAFAALRKTTTLEEIRARWRSGLKSNDKWLGVRTVAQLRSKWNDLAKMPLDLTGDWRSRVDHSKDFFGEHHAE